MTAEPDYIIEDLWPLVRGIDEARPDPSNAMTHDEVNLAQIAGSLNKHKQRKPIVVNWTTGTIEAGNGTWLAARQLGWDYLAMVGQEDDPQTAVSYGIADNAVASQVWDWERLKKHLDSFDDPQTVPGVDDALLETLKEALAAEELNGKGGEDAPPQVDKAAQLQVEYGTALGQVWTLGRHRLAVGDCTERGVVEGVMAGDSPSILIADPPYGMNLDASYSNSVDNPKKNIKKSRGYKKVIGDDRPFDLTPLLKLFDDVSEQFYWGADYYRRKLPPGGSWIVWDKRTSVEEVKYSSSEFELCWSKIPHQRFILRVPWFGIIGTEQQDIQTRLHPTQKPLGVIAPIIEKYGDDIILDPFLGSGTTLIACENLGRRCRGIDIDPGYAAVTIRRWEELTGEKAALERTQQRIKEGTDRDS